MFVARMIPAIASLLLGAALLTGSNNHVVTAVELPSLTIPEMIMDQERMVVFNSRRLTGECCKFLSAASLRARAARFDTDCRAMHCSIASSLTALLPHD